MSEKSESKHLLRHTSVVSFFTMLSRIFGLLRDITLAHVFGATAMLDAFFVAFKIPNLMRRLFAEGAFSQAFVPVLAEYKETRSPEDTREFIRHIAGNLGFSLLVFVLTAIVISPLLIWVFAPGFVFGSSSERFTLTVQMLRISFPYLMLISLTAMAAAIQNCYHRFALPAATPIILNLCIILSALLLAPYFESGVTALAWGVVLAGILQLTIQLPALKKLNLLPRPKVSWQDEGVKRVLKLIAPALFGVSVAQINLIIDNIFASFLPAGSISWLYYSDRVTALPLGVFGVAIATVSMPKLASYAANKNANGFTATVEWATRWILLIAMPAFIALSIIAIPVVSTLFLGKEFTVIDSINTANSLMAFALGLPAFMLVKIFASSFYAKQQIKIVVRIAIYAIILNTVLNAALYLPLKHVGLALSTALASWFNAVCLYLNIPKNSEFHSQLSWKKYFFALLTGLLTMTAFLFFMHSTPEQWFNWPLKERILHLGALVIGGLVCFGLGTLIAGLRPHHLKKPLY